MPAAGSGRRFGAQLPKQYAELHGRTVIEWALAPFVADPQCAGIVVALAAADPWWPPVAARLPAGKPAQAIEHRLAALQAAGNPHDAGRADERDRWPPGV